VIFTALLGHYTVRLGPRTVDTSTYYVASMACFAAITAVIPNADAAAPIVNAVILPVEFLSGIFIAFGNSTPDWILWVARVSPVRHFALSMQAGFLGTAFSWMDVLVVAAWGAGGLLVAIRYFSWEPRQG
jgi:ABC-2 type transport system permease protein